MGGPGGLGISGGNGDSGMGYANDIFLFQGAQLIFNGTTNYVLAFEIAGDPNAVSPNLDGGVIIQQGGP